MIGAREKEREAREVVVKMNYCWDYLGNLCCLGLWDLDSVCLGCLGNTLMSNYMDIRDKLLDLDYCYSRK